jgi:Fic family protein
VSSYIPLAVDGLIVLCILAIFSASLGGYNAAWLSGVVMAFTGLSIYFNVSHMPADVSLINRYLLGGAFPVIVFLASESTSWQIKRMVAFMATVRTYGELVITVGELTSRKATTETEIEANQAQAQALNEKIKNYQTTVTNLERDLVILSTSAEVNEENLETVERRVKIIRIKAADPRTTQAQLAEILGTSQRTISRDISELTNGIASNIINGKKG